MTGKKLYWLIAFLLAGVSGFAQADSVHRTGKKILLVPYPAMMYFSDADADLSRFSKMDEQRLRNQVRLSLEKDVHRQLLASFHPVSLINASALDGEADLKKIYAASRYYMSNGTGARKGAFASNLFRKKEKKQAFYASDSSVMVAEVLDPKLNPELHKKFSHDYMLYLTQFEIITSNKNTIEWTKQQYKRTYVLHYNLWDNTGKLVLAETLTLEADGENDLKVIDEKYFMQLAARLTEILAASLK